MEIRSFSSFFCDSVSSLPKQQEFEFQMSVCFLERDTTTSMADELFYKGKLLPLQLPPRLQMVEKLIQNSSPANKNSQNYTFEDFYGTPMTTTVATPTATSTPIESCIVSPSESCWVSKELNPEDCFIKYSSELKGYIGENPKKTWNKKLKLIKHSLLGLKASKAYLRSLFGKSGCSDESCTSAAKVADEESVSKAAVEKKKLFGQIQNERCRKKKSMTGSHRRSFSVSLRRQTTKKLVSPSRSSSAGGFHPLQLLKRSTSTNSDIESSIQGAIAHCKQSQQSIHSRKTANDAGFYSLSASRITVW